MRRYVVALAGAAAMAAAAVASPVAAPGSAGASPVAATRCLGAVILGFGETSYVLRTVGRRLEFGQLLGIGGAFLCDDTPPPPGDPGAPPAYDSAVRRLRGIRPRVAVAARWDGRWRLFVATDRCGRHPTGEPLLRCLRAAR